VTGGAVPATPGVWPEASDPLLAAALRYAHRGFRVLPVHSIRDGCCTCPSRACSSPGKHPRIESWPELASANPERIRRWWSQWPGSNIGLATGGGLVILDVDPRNGGDQTLYEFVRTQGPLPPTVRVDSGGGGYHYYFRSGPRIRKRKVGSGLDLLGEGGFVVAPPSVHPAGRRYEFAPGCGLDANPLAALPAWLETRSHASAPLPPDPSHHRIQVGFRNTALASEAGRLRRLGLEGPEIGAQLLEFNARLCDPPLDEDEVRRIASSVARYEPTGRTLKDIHGAVDALPALWKGQGGASNWAVLHALLELGGFLGKTSFDCSVRDLSLRAGLDFTTASRALRRLEALRWVERGARPMNPLHARELNLRLAPAVADELQHTDQVVVEQVCVAVPSHDLWSSDGLGKSALLLWSQLALRRGWSLKALAERMDLSKEAVRRRLRVLAAFDLAVWDPLSEVWLWARPSLDRIAGEAGALGRGLRRSDKIQRERDQRQEYFRTRHGVDLATGEDLSAWSDVHTVIR
jgi:Bifunctional DNA primase/polymerase, N-terminal/Primase C terminal 1 (PriCT-1)